MEKYLLITLLAPLVAIFWLKLFWAKKILDNPGPDQTRKYRVPNFQWIFLVLGILLSIFIFYPSYLQVREVQGLILWWILLFVITLVDTVWKGISPKRRLVAQAGAGLIAFGFWVGITKLPLFWNIDPIFWMALTAFWFVLFTNAINWFDDASWTGAWNATLWFLAILLLINYVVLPSFPNITDSNLASLEIVKNLAFIFFVYWAVYTALESKPYWLMRDIWLMFLSYWLAYLSLQWGAKVWIVLSVLSLVIFDAIWVFLNRIFVLKKNPMKWDYTHLWHRLVANGWSRWEIKWFVWRWSSFLMLIMLFLWVGYKAKIVLFIFLAITFFAVNWYLFWYKKIPSQLKKWDKKS